MVPGGPGDGLIDGIYTPDLTIPVKKTCEDAGWSFSQSSATSVNDPELCNRLIELSPQVVVYSGYGGQLIVPEVLDTAEKFLHIHAGWLPTYRGSTTIYYSWLERNICGVSAIILDKHIDTGAIVARREFPAPPPDVDVDLVYDNAIRASLLVDVLRQYETEGHFIDIPKDEETNPYYVIHPVLKHIALLTR